jgi:hypothetical protein
MLIGYAIASLRCRFTLGAVAPMEAISPSAALLAIAVGALATALAN